MILNEEKSMGLNPGERISIPSPIDVHTHLREPGGEDKETIESGTRAALAGGYQAVFDMPNNPNGHQTWSEERLDEKIEIGEKTAHTKIGFYAGVDPENPALDEIPGMIRKSSGLKLYMGHTTGNTKEHDLEAVRPAIDAWIVAARDYGVYAPILLHAREEIGEQTAEYVASQGYPVHWCHIASITEVVAAKRLTEQYPEFYTGGVTPHHLTMTDRNADFQQGWNGARMQPPLGTEIDAEALLRAYNDSDIQILETDHAPHIGSDKYRAEAENPEGKTDLNCTTCFGISGIEFVLPVMVSLVQRNKVTIGRLVDSLYDQPAKMLRINTRQNTAKTHLEIAPRILGESDIVGMSRNHPYLGWTGWARVLGVEVANHAKILRTGSSL
jgi:dihydroorotase